MINPNFPLDDDSQDDFDMEKWKAQKHTAYEEKIIKFIARHLGLEAAAADARARCKEVTGIPTLNWDWFEERTNFPVTLYFRSIPFIHKMTVADLYSRFTATPIYKELTKVIDTHDLNLCYKSIGMVFNMPSVGTMVFHNWQHADDDGTIILRFISYRSGGAFLVLEPLAHLLKTIKLKQDFGKPILTNTDD